MSDPLTHNQVDQLGKRLRDAGQPDGKSLDLLRRLRDAHLAPMTQAEAALRDLGFQATSRLKTVNTIVEKLRRFEKTRLSQMQDVAGLRVVGEWTLMQQNEAYERIARAFSQNKVVDRRERPTHGYRAVHVIARIDG